MVGTWHCFPAITTGTDTKPPFEKMTSGFNDLMSFLNQDTKLLSSSIENKIMTLKFNEAIFNSIEEKDILEEVIYTISLSIKDNYDVNEVIFNVENEEILIEYEGNPIICAKHN